jgi:hypothetical protein
MERRYVRFNMNELAQVAAQSIGAGSCTSVRKFPDGMYNKSFTLTMDDGQEVVAKVPNPNAGLAHYSTASEVATMDFVSTLPILAHWKPRLRVLRARNTLGTPVPKVFAWNSRADDAVGAEYIIMEKMAGVQLSEVWKNMKLVDKMQLRLNLARYQEVWLSASFRQFGGLYYRQDLESGPSEDYLYTNQKGENVHDSRFTIGPMTGRDWCDCRRSALICYRGPCKKHRHTGLHTLNAFRAYLI